MSKLEAKLYGPRWKPFIGFIALILALPFFVHAPHIFTILILIGIYSITTVGLNLLAGYAGQVSLGHAAFFAIGAYVSGMATTKSAISPWAALLLAMAITFAVAWLIGIPILKLKGHFLALATLGFNIIVYILISGLTDYTGGALGLNNIPALSLFGLDLSDPLHFYYVIWALAALVILFSTNIVRSPIGRLLRSIHDSEIATETLGVNAAKYKVYIFALSASFASLSGSMYAHFIHFIAPPTVNTSFSILLLIMVMVGGSHSIWGAPLGTAIIMFLQEVIRNVSHSYLKISGPVEIVVYGFVIVLVMMFLPQGTISLFSRLDAAFPRIRNKTLKQETGG
ncbi:branched-chain amino acid ABC transporter permease [Cohnella sp. AR92]|uniref:branched-chain amino acid ABC transporter permease n=1 Tax=Cohnella sp. AR92 TaxID=648716 RepID=UPI000F8D41AC|nr:branched-chain amino acid ABC transporter permease [Cohnella sp. AR92]RUS45736.1 branched-chain amino acid ABC transporter permease [Cohnella sp. AR92]